ncbi:PREDICTED: uncharacterized protein LOC109165997 [Ipomoea nil]|uniref:uncharacterized protein LOC109165997 n=1 Tax=Ipomoea nil TaxID=35883 RepID=UPI0009016EF3|nr:PREDICTED: uncharacterized protein LOC109165997 [Ipomoea nil]
MEYDRVEREWLALLEQQHVYWRQRAKEHWWVDGDLNSKYFHNSVRTRRRRNRVAQLTRDDGTVAVGVDEVGGVMVDYYKGLFTSQPGDVDEVVVCLGAGITARDNAVLERAVSVEEVREAVFAMHPDKSPGPDGFGPGFFQHFWPTVGGEVTRFCQQFLETARLPARANETLIVLIPKKPEPSSMKDLRLIALCNVLYKIAAKVCANRLRPLLDKVISRAQSAFVPGRLITDNILLAFEAHHYLKRKTQGMVGVAALKVDMSKAYDRVEWRFLRAVMLKLGFSARWVDIIMETVCGVQYHILYEPRQLGPIVPGRGLRQGDPLSPYLFLMVVEGLSFLIENRMRRGMLHGVRVARGAPPISHLLFADDCFLFLRANSEESTHMKQVLDLYAGASGQLVNYEKSQVCFSANTDQGSRNAVENVLGVQQGDTSGRYLGLPSMVGRGKRAILGFLKERILARVRGWNTRFLSRAGREVLLKNVLQALPSYAMMVFALPVSLCREIEVILNRYWWTGKVVGTSGIRWRSWKAMCVPKAKGGLGFRTLREMNLALLGKQAWRLLTRPDSLVARVYKSRYYPNCHLMNAEVGHNPSYVWRSIVEANEAVKWWYQRSIGDGRSTKIGRDPWLVQAENPYVTTQLHDTVSDAPVSSLMNMAGTAWDRDCVMDVFNARDAAYILNTPLSIRRPMDAWVWKGDSKGAYTVKSCYRLLTREVQTDYDWNRIWHLQVPPKVRVFAWQLAKDVLPTREALARKRVACMVICHMCGTVDETNAHMFRDCYHVRVLWGAAGLPVLTHDHGSIVQWFFEQIAHLKDDLLPKFVMICWAVWKSRNATVWSGVQFNAAVVLREAVTYWENWRAVQVDSGGVRSGSAGRETWARPGTGRIKLNCDAALDASRNVMGLGWVLRDDGGGFLAAKSMQVDSIRWLRQRSCACGRLCLGFVVREWEVASLINGVNFAFVKRSANLVAHALARGAVSVTGPGEWLDGPPELTVEEVPSAANSVTEGASSSSSETNSTPSTGPVTEDEIRAVLLQEKPVTTQDLVNQFISRLKSREDKNTFAAALRRISRIEATNTGIYVVLSER